MTSSGESVKEKVETLNLDEDLDNLKLSELFDRGWRLQRELYKTSLDETCNEYLLKRKKSVEMLKKAQFMLDELNLFSENEDLDEISTSEIR